MFRAIELTSILIPISFFVTVVVIIYLYLSARLKRNQFIHEERMAAIEKGVNIPMAPAPERWRNPFVWPLILIAIGIALIIAPEVEYAWALGFILVGAALLASHFLFQHQAKKREQDEPKAEG